LAYIRDNLHVAVSPPPAGHPPPPPGASNGQSSRSQSSPPPLSNVVALAPSDPRQNLQPLRTRFVHKDKIFAICYDPLNDNLITSSKDGTVTLWTADGSVSFFRFSSPLTPPADQCHFCREKKKPLTRIEISSYYASAIDMNPKTGLVVVAAKEVNDSLQNPVAFVYDLKSPKEEPTFVLKDSVKKKEIKQISAVKVLMHQSQFVLGESSPKQKRHAICLYSVGNSINQQTTYEEHEDLVTSFCSYTEQESMFFSASRDCSVRLWDSRKPQSAGKEDSPVVSFPTRPTLRFLCRIVWVDNQGDLGRNGAQARRARDLHLIIRLARKSFAYC